jgi:hypothetical protein
MGINRKLNIHVFAGRWCIVHAITAYHLSGGGMGYPISKLGEMVLQIPARPKCRRRLARQ